MKILRLGATYGAPPIFDGDMESMGHLSPENLNLSENLIQRIMVWDEEFQKTFCDYYPPDSGFESDMKRRNHNNAGLMLSKDIQSELGKDYQITFCEV